MNEKPSSFKTKTVFTSWFLNNRFSVVLLNLFLFFLTIWMFNQISFMLNPVWVFINAIFPPLLLAAVQYYLMNPIVDWLENNYRIPRIASILVIFIIVLLIFIWLITSLVPVVQHQIDALIKNWPNIWNNAVHTTQKILKDPRLSIVQKNLNQMVKDTQKTWFRVNSNPVLATVGNLSSAVSVVTMIFMTLLTAPFVLFFMLKDGHRLRPYIVQFFPQRWQKGSSELLHDINNAISAYIRGQLVVAFWVGVMFTIGYTIIGLPYGTALAVLSAVLNLIPYFGTPIAMIPTLIIAALTSIPMLIKVLIVFSIEQILESRVIGPLVVGNKMKMNPVTTILLLIGAGSVSGLWGVIFGIPIYAVLKIVVSRVYNYYRKTSQVYQEEDLPESDSKKE